MSSLRTPLVSGIVFACSLLIVAPELGAIGLSPTTFEGYTTTTWKAEDGLPNQTTQAFEQTPDGSLWIGTKGGLLRFDGARFTAYSREIAPAALERGVNCLFVARDGSLWIGTEGGGLVRYRDRTFQSYPSAGGVTNEFVRTIHEDRNGRIWVGGDQGLFRVAGASLVRVDNTREIPQIFVRSIAEDRGGHIWVGGTQLLEFSGTTLIQQIRLPDGPTVGLIRAVQSGADGTLWVGMLTGLYRLSGGGALQRVAEVPAPVSAIKQTADGTIWIGTIGHGIFSYRQRRFSRTASHSLPSQTVRAILEDREHNIWLGTQAGIVRLSRTPVNIVPLPGGLDSEIETLYRDHDGTVWVVASGHLFRIQNGADQAYAFPGLRGLRVRTMLRDRKDDFWIGTDGAGLLHMQGKHAEWINHRNRLINDFVRGILQSRDGSIWVGTDGGLTHLKAKGSDSFDVANGLAYFSVTALFEDRRGDIWAGTSRGLTHIANGRIVHDAVTKALAQEELWSILQDGSGELWFATSNGLYGWKSGQLIHLTMAQGLADNTIYQILDDGKGNIWLSGPNSISRLKLCALDEFRPGARVELTLYEDAHDLGSAAFYGGFQPEGAVAPNGDVWFPSNKGTVHVSAAQIPPVTPSPVRIDQVLVEGQQVQPERDVVLKAGNSRLEISYSAIHLRSQGGLRYRYKMEGLEPWTEASTRRTAYFTHLPPGHYRFRVQAYEAGNPNSVSDASIVIVQKPHFYSTSWFLGSSLLALSGIGFLIYRLRLHQMRLRFSAVIEERTRLAREMHDTVIQGCVGVSTLLEAALGVEESEGPLRQQLLSYATEQVRGTIESAREAVWALRNTIASNANVGVLCEELARQFQIDSNIPVRSEMTGIPFRLGELTTHELMMIVKEAVTNALSHANPSAVQIDVQFNDQSLQVAVQDDGCGFDPEAALARNGHYGIVGMHERVQLLRGTLDVVSDGTHGTTIRIIVPKRQKITERVVAGHANR